MKANSVDSNQKLFYAVPDLHCLPRSLLGGARLYFNH